MGFETEGYESSGVDNIAVAVYVCSLLLEQYGSGLNFADDAKGIV